MQTLHKGILIALEGIDGSGKSTLAQHLYKELHNRYPVILTREPGASLLGQELRTLLQTQQVPICPKAQFLLFAADRAQHMHDIVKPHLDTQHIVISDRMADSSLAYQAYGNGLDIDMIRLLNRWTMENREPDLIIYAHIPVTIALERIAQRGAASAYEKESFLHKVYAGYEALYQNNPRVMRIDATESLETVTHTAYNKVTQWLRSHS